MKPETVNNREIASKSDGNPVSVRILKIALKFFPFTWQDHLEHLASIRFPPGGRQSTGSILKNVFTTKNSASARMTVAQSVLHIRVNNLAVYVKQSGCADHTMLSIF